MVHFDNVNDKISDGRGLLLLYDNVYATELKFGQQFWAIEDNQLYGPLTVYAFTNSGVVALEETTVYSYDNVFEYKETAEKFIHKKVKIAIDDHGREVDYAMFEGDQVIELYDDYKVHTSHCCVIHGCKYGDKDCPVVNKKILQKYPCQECDKPSLDDNWRLIFNEFKNKGE